MSSDSNDYDYADLSPGQTEIEVVEAHLVDDADAPATTRVTRQLTHLHPTSLIFDLIAHGRTYLVPAAFGLWGAAKGDLTLLIISALIFVPAFLASVFRYFTFRYSIQDDKLVVTQGLIFRNARTVPVSRIQNIDFVQNPLQRILKVAEVKVETASGTKPEATLRVLSLAKMEELRTAVFGSATKRETQSPDSLFQSSPSDSLATALATGAEHESVVDGENVDAATLLQIPVTWLFQAGLASNRGLIMVGVLFGAYYQFGGERRPELNIRWFNQFVPDEASTAFIAASVIAGLIVALVLLRLLGIGWFILRFFGYKLARRGDDLRISCGLLTKVSATIPRQRIQFISIHRNMIMRMMGLASIRIETAGGAGKEGEDATETVSKRWFVPVIPEKQVPELLSAIRPDLDWNESSLDFKPLAVGAVTRLSRLAIGQSILLAGVGQAITRPWGWAIGVVAIPFLLVWAVKKSQAMRYARTDNGVVYCSGVFNRKTSITFFEKIQTLRVDQSPFDRRWKMAQLSVDTAAAGPADHRIQVPYLEENFARDELQWLRKKTGQEQPVFL